MHISILNLNSAKLALKTCLSSKWLSLLSISTVVLGAAAITATLTINSNVREYAKYLVDRFGGPTLKISLDQPNLFFSESDIKNIKAHPSVLNISTDRPVRLARVQVGDQMSVVDVALFKPETKSSAKIKWGRHLTELDNDCPCVIISKQLLMKFNERKDRVSGDHVDNIKIIYAGRAIAARVVGVFELDDLTTVDSGMIFATKNLVDAIYSDSANNYILVRAKDLDRLDGIESFVQHLFKDRFRESLRIVNTRTLVANTEKDLFSLVGAGLALGFLALISGSVGLMNVMLLSIRIRRKEIGLYRAIGFSSKNILLQFLFEFLILSFVGSVLGTTVGLFLGATLSEIVIPPFNNLSLISALIGIVVTVFVGLIFGLYPSFRAIALEPVEALKG